MSIDFGRPTLVLRIAGCSVRADRRSLVVSVVIALVTLVAVIVALGSGDTFVAPGDVVQALLGGGSRVDRIAVREFQAPRVLAALGFGAALGLSGAIFQLLTRNPLGSPDIIGFGVGSYTGALVAGLVFSGGYLMTAGGALAGGLITAIIVYALAFRDGVGGFRLVIIGVAVSAMLAAVNYWLILRADLGEAMDAAQWGAGNLAVLGAKWELVTPALVVIAVLIVGVAALARRHPILELGPDLGRTLGADTRAAQIGLPVLGVALTAAATAVAGPIAFIALAAPHIARRLVGGGRTPLVATALTGSALLVISDVIAIRAFAPRVMPVGVVTVCVGGCYLLYLLSRELRQDR